METAKIQQCSGALDIVIPSEDSGKYLAGCLGDVIAAALSKISIVGMDNAAAGLPNKYVAHITVNPFKKTRKWRPSYKISLKGIEFGRGAFGYGHAPDGGDLELPADMNRRKCGARR